jgi:hypothetical protein
MIDLNYGDYKFTEFTEKVQNVVSTDMYGEGWMAQMLKISSLAKLSKVEDKVTFSNDALILAAFKIMLKVDLRDIGLTEWAILNRYIEKYYIDDAALKEKIKMYINLYIGSTFSDYKVSEEKMEEMASIKQTIANSGIEMPKFFYGEEAPKELTTNVESDDDVLQEWMNLKEICEIGLADKKTSKKDRIMYEELLVSVALFV